MISITTVALFEGPFVIAVVQLLSRVQLCDPMDCSTPGFPVHHQLLELTQTHVHRIGDTIQPSCPLLFPFSSCLQYFPALWSFPKTLRVYLQITVHICKIQSRIWFLLSRSLKSSQTGEHHKHHMRHDIRIYVLVWISSGTVLST